MEKEITLYLAGSIKKKHELENATYWNESHRKVLEKCLSPRDTVFLNPAERTDDLSNQKSVFGRDMTQVFSADAVFVDARNRRGLGVGAEMMWAKFHRIPVIAWAPLGTHYNKEKTSLLDVEVSDWVHPFVECLSDVVIETLESGAEWLIAHLEDGRNEIKDADWIQEAMRHYYDAQYGADVPMQELAARSEKLKNRLESIQVGAL